ncbi:MAG: VOC family protein [Planctomycetia bacterium]|nr:VOC family protein [Planctomycetia bacterium]
MHIQPYLIFSGRCDEALAFYTQAIGAKVLTRLRFKDSPVPQPPGTLAPGMEDKVMHSSFRVGESEIFASDGHCQEATNFHGFSLSLTLDDVAEVERAFAALLDGGKVNVPLAKPSFRSRSRRRPRTHCRRRRRCVPLSRYGRRHRRQVRHLGSARAARRRAAAACA